MDLVTGNGTFVNGVPIGRKALSHGDTIRVGNSELLFVLRDNEAAHAFDEQGDAMPPTAGVKTIRIDESQFQSGFGADFGAQVGRIVRDLTGLLRITTVINSTREIGELQREILRFISEVIPSDDSAIVLMSPADDEPASICGWSHKNDKGCDVEIEPAIVARAIWERSAVITETTHHRNGCPHVLCFPLIGVQRTIGVIYLTSCEAASPIQEDHIHFLTSAARIAAVALENILTLDRLSSENRQLKEQIFSSKLVGEGRSIRKVDAFVSRVAAEEATVLIRGESGTGKELVARAIHHNSPRSDRPFVAINCAAIPETLLESELFGHEKGAFTGAAMLKKGKLEAAEDGTLFLDEIGDLAAPLQAKLLRVLQQREFERLGGNRAFRFAARVVAATNKDLEKAIKAGEFRQDLYYRLNVVSVTVPPLRERREDIPLLALYFASKFASRRKRPFKGISAEARAILMHYAWPGNVRELENAIEHAMVLGVSDEILPEDLPAAMLELDGAPATSSRYHSAINNTRKELILDALRNTSWNFPDAAKALGIHPKYLFRLVRNLKLRTELE